MHQAFCVLTEIGRTAVGCPLSQDLADNTGIVCQVLHELMMGKDAHLAAIDILLGDSHARRAKGMVRMTMTINNRGDGQVDPGRLPEVSQNPLGSLIAFAGINHDKAVVSDHDQRRCQLPARHQEGLVFHRLVDGLGHLRCKTCHPWVDRWGRFGHCQIVESRADRCQRFQDLRVGVWLYVQWNVFHRSLGCQKCLVNGLSLRHGQGHGKCDHDCNWQFLKGRDFHDDAPLWALVSPANGQDTDCA